MGTCLDELNMSEADERTIRSESGDEFNALLEQVITGAEENGVDTTGAYAIASGDAEEVEIHITRVER